MNLHVLVTCPANTKLFIDLTCSAMFVRQQHPQLTIDIFLEKSVVPDWWKPSASWMQLKHAIPECVGPYDLVVQTTPDEELAQDLLAVDTENRSGVVASPNLHVQGRWAQTLVAQLGSSRFAPFTPFDLFNHVLLGRTTMDFNHQGHPSSGRWIVDLDSFDPGEKSWAEEVLALISLTHSGHSYDRLARSMDPCSVACYIGSNAAAASWLSYHGAQVMLITTTEWKPIEAPANTDAWIVPQHQLPTPGQVLVMLRSGESRWNCAFRHTAEYLGGQLPVLGGGKIDRPEIVFDRLHYIVFNYLNDLIEVDLPIPEVTPACCLRLKGAQAVFGKLVHLNQFGIKFLQDFLSKVASGSVKDSDIDEISKKMSEIDSYTEKTLSVYPEMDLLRLYSQFSKAGAQGENVIEISKSMILILNESNQAMHAYSELIDSIVRRHGLRTDTTRP